MGPPSDAFMPAARMKAADRKELTRLQREHKNLMQHNYRPGLGSKDLGLWV